MAEAVTNMADAEPNRIKGAVDIKAAAKAGAEEEAEDGNVVLLLQP